MKNLEPEILIDCNRGIYIMQQFATVYGLPENFANYEQIKEDLEYIANEANMDNDDYFETCADVLDNARLINKDGVKMYLYQQDDLWAVPEGYENEDFFNC
jgi:hypothetical protein